MRVKFRIGLKCQFALLAIFLISLTSGVSGYYTLRREKQVLQDQVVTRGRFVASGLASTCAEALLPVPDDLYLATLLKETVSNQGIEYALIVDQAGWIVGHSDITKWGKRHTTTTWRVRNPLDKTLIDICWENGREFYDFSAPIMVGNNSRLGTVHIGVPVVFVSDLLDQSRQRLGAVTLALSVVGIIVSTIMAGLVIAPIQRLARGAERLGKGELGYRINMSRRDEFGLLADGFNSMASSLSELYLDTLQMLANALEAKDFYSRGHTDRVTRYSVEIARKMNLPEAEIDTIRKAAMIHDIGKIGIRESILNKPAKLTEEEYEHIKTHSSWGARILEPIPSLAVVASYVLYHHERLDGSGYPRGLTGTDIPLGARVIAVADTFDAMTSDRPYRKALPDSIAVAEIMRFSKTKLDPEVVRAFLEVAKSPGSYQLDSIPAKSDLCLAGV